MSLAATSLDQLAKPDAQLDKQPEAGFCIASPGDGYIVFSFVYSGTIEVFPRN